MKYKCPKCQSKIKSKNGVFCPCGYTLAFNPKIDAPMNDELFMASLKNVSNNGTTFYTKNQLYTVLFSAKCFKKITFTSVLIGLSLLSIAGGFSYLCFLWKNDAFLLSLSFFFALFFFLFGIFQMGPESMGFPKKKLDDYIDQWKRSDKSMGPYIEALALTQLPPDWNSIEKSFGKAERILVVQHDLLVDLFVKNGFQQKYNTIVISKDGYPNYHIPSVKKILSEKKKLPVYYLFDSMKTKPNFSLSLSELGIELGKLRPIVECGLTPSQVSCMEELTVIKPNTSGFLVPVDALLYPTLEEKVLFCFKYNLPIGYTPLRSIIPMRDRVVLKNSPEKDKYYRYDYYDVDNDDMDDDDDDGDDGDD